MSTPFYHPDEFADTVREHLADMYTTSEFFQDERILYMLEPYPERAAILGFMSWLSDRVLYELTTETEPTLAPAAKGRRPKLMPLPVEEAMLHYGVKDDGFPAFLRDAGIKLSDAGGDDVYDYFQSLRECGSVEELGDRMADAAFALLFADLSMLEAFQDLAADKVREVEGPGLDVDQALMFEGPGVLRAISPPRWVTRQVLQRDASHCAACAALAAGRGTPAFEQLVPCGTGGLNDVGNLRLACPAPG